MAKKKDYAGKLKATDQVYTRKTATFYELSTPIFYENMEKAKQEALAMIGVQVEEERGELHDRRLTILRMRKIGADGRFVVVNGSDFEFTNSDPAMVRAIASLLLAATELVEKNGK